MFQQAQEENRIKEIIDDIWKKYDVDGNGSLDKQETRNFLIDTLDNLGAKASFSDAGFEEIFKAFDLDGNETIDKTEMVDFIKMMQDNQNPDKDESSSKLSKQKTLISGKNKVDIKLKAADFNITESSNRLHKLQNNSIAMNLKKQFLLHPKLLKNQNIKEENHTQLVAPTKRAMM